MRKSIKLAIPALFLALACQGGNGNAVRYNGAITVTNNSGSAVDIFYADDHGDNTVSQVQTSLANGNSTAIYIQGEVFGYGEVTARRGSPGSYVYHVFDVSYSDGYPDDLVITGF